MRLQLSPFQWSSLSFFGFFCAYGVLLPFFPLWLKESGYATETIGTLVSLGFLFRFLGGISISQRIRQPNQLISMIRLLAWISVAVTAAMAWAVESIWLLLPVFALFHILNGGAMPLNETIASTWQKQVGIDYGKTRLFGSIAFVVGSISTGYLVGWLGEKTIIWIIFGWLLFLACGQMLNPSCYFAESEQKQTARTVTYGELLRDKTTLRMLLAITLIQASHAAYYSYSTIHWLAQGISPQTSSLLWGTAVTAEICLFFVANRLFRNWAVPHLLMISATLTALRWVILANTTDVTILVLEQSFHAFSFGLGHYAMVRYISSQSTEKIAKLQGLYFALASCGFMAIFTFFSGLIYPHSPYFTFLLMSLCALPALLIVPKKLPVQLR